MTLSRIPSSVGSKRAFLALTLAIAFGVPAVVLGEGDKPKNDKKVVAPKKATPAPRKAERWALLDVSGRLRIVRGEEVKAVRDEVAAEYKADLREWTKARLDAKKAKEKFSKPRPKSKLVKVISSALKSEEAARELKAKTEEKLRKSRARLTGKFVIVAVGDEQRVIKRTDYAKLQRETAAKYREDLKQYQASQRKAKKGAEPAEPKPVLVTVKVVEGGFATEEAAEKRLDELESGPSDDEPDRRRRSARPEPEEPEPEEPEAPTDDDNDL